MFNLALVLVLLPLGSDARRVQKSLELLEQAGLTKADSPTPSLHSLAKAAQSSNATASAAFIPGSVSVGRAGKGRGQRVPQISMTALTADVDHADMQGDEKITREPLNADTQILDVALGSQASIQKSAQDHEQAHGDSRSAHGDKESEFARINQHEVPWYANLRSNGAILAVAMLCSRVALAFRKSTSSLQAHSMSPALSDGASSSRVPAIVMNAEKASEATSKKGFRIDMGLITCVSLWYLGNYYYNITNKLALNAAGPAQVGFGGAPLTVSTLQLVVGAVYAVFLWLAPDARKRPTITFKDWVATLPVSAASAAGHAFTVFAFSAGSVSFGQIVKAAEPACAALLGLVAYGTVVSRAKWLSLIPVIAGVGLASAGEINFAWAAFLTAFASNLSGAIRANENKKLMSTPGLSERLGSVGNQYAISTINQLLISIPFVLFFEGRLLGNFWQVWKSNPVLVWNTIFSGIWYYMYNELSTIVIKKTNAVTQTVLSTAKRVIIIIGVAIVLGESLPPIKLIGSIIGITGVFLYSMAK